MAMLSTGPGSVSDRGTLRRTVQVPTNDLRTTDPSRPLQAYLSLTLRYNYLSSEYPNFIGTQFNDLFTVDLELPSGERLRIVDESVNTTEWTLIPGIDFPSGDGTVGQSGWRTASALIPALSLRGATTFDIVVRDQGDRIYDSVALIDDISVR
jgi:hypothetical protein